MTPESVTLGQAFLEQLRAQSYGGEVGLAISTLEGEVLVCLNAERAFLSASTIKVPLLLLALERVQTGQLRLNERHTLKPADRVGGAGILHELGAGLELSLEDLLTLMIIVSDNTATNMVIDLLGVDAVNAWLFERGCRQTRLVGKLQLPPEQQNAAQLLGERNRTSAAEQAELLLGLWQGQRLEPPVRQLALSILGRQHYRDILGRSLLRHAANSSRYQTYTKSGELLGVHHDVGLLLLPRPLCVALLSEGGSDRREHPENQDTLVLSTTLFPLLAALGGLDQGISGDI
ncbi:serine hydrolase [Deinococcus psychrotolerans]|uniref:serine hydrolase n=1 Tax=Deinococcus psychrotolerans TaxID=2489213 RepID=UPI001F14B6B6|nr:serine hydrolase [Deinococcus psychrotolerans]